MPIVAFGLLACVEKVVLLCMNASALVFVGQGLANLAHRVVVHDYRLACCTLAGCLRASAASCSGVAGRRFTDTFSLCCLRASFTVSPLSSRKPTGKHHPRGQGFSVRAYLPEDSECRGSLASQCFPGGLRLHLRFLLRGGEQHTLPMPGSLARL